MSAEVPKTGYSYPLSGRQADNRITAHGATHTCHQRSTMLILDSAETPHPVRCMRRRYPWV